MRQPSRAAQRPTAAGSPGGGRNAEHALLRGVGPIDPATMPRGCRRPPLGRHPWGSIPPGQAPPAPPPAVPASAPRIDVRRQRISDAWLQRTAFWREARHVPPARVMRPTVDFAPLRRALAVRMTVPAVQDAYSRPRLRRPLGPWSAPRCRQPNQAIVLYARPVLGGCAGASRMSRRSMASAGSKPLGAAPCRIQLRSGPPPSPHPQVRPPQLSQVALPAFPAGLRSAGAPLVPQSRLSPTPGRVSPGRLGGRPGAPTSSVIEHDGLRVWRGMATTSRPFERTKRCKHWRAPAGGSGPTAGGAGPGGISARVVVTLALRPFEVSRGLSARSIRCPAYPGPSRLCTEGPTVAASVSRPECPAGRAPGNRPGDSGSGSAYGRPLLLQVNLSPLVRNREMTVCRAARHPAPFRPVGPSATRTRKLVIDGAAAWSSRV